KNLVMAMKLAQHHLLHETVQDPPILLLDDLFDRLDQQRVERLMQIILKSNFGQLFITDTRLDRVQRILSGTPVKAFELVTNNSDEEE
ncbi:MAG: DNA replication and repair protein RecF, partial [Saprospiraceae bacterium]|nr:DNA replication and repair protein RecF [Saprospiraceae bacterium]